MNTELVHKAPADSVSAALPVVCIGISMGGLEPLKAIFRSLSSNTGMAFVVPEMVHFAKAHHEQLDDMPAWFFSVTLSQAGAQRTGDSPEKHLRFVADVQRMVTNFCRQTGWMPNRIVPVAGALLYSKYNFLIRFIMKWIASGAGTDTDTSRDYEYTDWVALDRSADQIASEVLLSPIRVQEMPAVK